MILLVVLACGAPADPLGPACRFRGAETCNGVDDDCDGFTDESDAVDTIEWSADEDGDGFGAGGAVFGCTGPVGFVDNAEDCDDSNATVRPGATETCNGADDDCDRLVDEDGGTAWYPDEDGDGFGGSESVVACDAPVGMVADASDCDDTDASINPAAPDGCNKRDDDCDGEVDEDPDTAWYADQDGDRYGAGDPSFACDAPEGFVERSGDCDDGDADVSPAARESCNGMDDNCEGTVDEDGGVAWYPDTDDDGYGAGTAVTACEAPPGYVHDSSDCDDGNPAVHPGTVESCNGLDDDCDAVADDDDPATVDLLPFSRDADGDGFGGAPVDACEAPADAVDNADDCDDTNADIRPGADEVCDGVDNDCDGAADVDAIDGIEVPADRDGDGFGAATGTMIGCSTVDNTLDCDDTNPLDPMVVDDNAGKVQDGSLAFPFDNLQDAIDASATCVYVQPGTYGGGIDFDGHDVRVFSAAGATDTVIEAGRDFGFRIDSGELAAELDGFTIVGGIGAETIEPSSGECASATVCSIEIWRYRGAGVMVDGANATLSHLVIQDGAAPGYNHLVISTTEESYTYSYGGGIYVGNGTVAISNVDVSANEALYGGGLCIGDNATVDVRNARFAYNSSMEFSRWLESGGGGIAVLGASTTATFTNVLVVGNTTGGGVYVEDAAVTLRNGTLVGNEGAVDGGAGVTVLGLGTVTLDSSIAWEDDSAVYVEAGASFIGTYSDVSSYEGIADPTGTDGNLCADPLFLNWTDDATDGDDLHLGLGSPAMDAGDPAALDLDGSRSDQGAYGGPGAEG